ncbi:hypothetical protein ANN_18686 [Periplaneta americana]|uniref:DPF1-3 N-terminal domain-containing protein n=1 Tax=Periplaneta americana TaxID=6978 RepID=A0ABQ8SPF9_PERAM|nr:hypothetical protein ANN_18686 [Periplaneta americana]
MSPESNTESYPAFAHIGFRKTPENTPPSFLNDSSYREAIENSANYNTRLCIERRLRMPFLDSQTDKTGIFSRLTQDKTLKFKGETRVGGKLSKTVLEFINRRKNSAETEDMFDDSDDLLLSVLLREINCDMLNQWDYETYATIDDDQLQPKCKLKTKL